MRMLLAVTPLVALLSGCPALPPRFHMRASEFPALQRGGGAVLRLDLGRTITRTGVLIFVRDKRRSPLVYARSVVVGDEGVCFHSSYPAAGFWQALRLDQVDPRIASRVIRPRDGVRLVRTANTSWDLEGSSGALLAWLRDHLRAVEDAHRNFIDLPPITYATRTALGWAPSDADALAELARPPGLFGKLRKPTILVGWRWSEFERIEYFHIWGDSTPSDDELATAIWENDDDVHHVIEKRAGLAPGPCPLTGRGKPLLAAAPS